MLSRPAPPMAALLVVLLGYPAWAAATPAVPSVPGDDIFGFSSPSDPGNPGDQQIFNENDGREGKAGGHYGALASKLAYGVTFTQDWWIGVGGFTAVNRTASVPGLSDVARAEFDGLSVELLHRVIARSAGNPFAVTLSVEPRWGRVDPATGLTSENGNITFKLFADAVIVPDELFWGGNIQFGTGRARDPLGSGRWQGGSGLQLSTALTWQVTPTLYAGTELRYLSAWDRMTPTDRIGQAVYLGPTLLWKVTDKVAMNATLQPQLWGRSRGEPQRRLDLTNFERAQFRLKLSVGL